MKLFFTKEVKIGLIVVFTSALFIYGLNYMKGVNLFKPSNYYYATFPEVEGLAKSGPVYINGYQVGVIREIRYDYSTNKDFVVEFSVDPQIRIPKGSKVVMVKGLMGGASILIRLNMANSELEPKGVTLVGEVDGGLMADFQKEVLPQVGILLPKLDSILVGINDLVNSPALKGSLKNMEKVTSELALLSRDLNVMVHRDVQPVLENVKILSADLCVISKTVKDLPLNSMVASLDVTIKNLEKTTTQLQSKESNIGLLLHDRALYDNLNSTVTSANALLVDLKANPKRYVHFSLF